MELETLEEQTFIEDPLLCKGDLPLRVLESRQNGITGFQRRRRGGGIVCGDADALNAQSAG